jgi:hypothetical protein
MLLIDGFGLVNGLIDHLHTSLGSARYYRAAADLHNLQITAGNTKRPPASKYFHIRFHVTNVNGAVSSASYTQVLPVGRITLN